MDPVVSLVIAAAVVILVTLVAVGLGLYGAFTIISGGE